MIPRPVRLDFFPAASAAISLIRHAPALVRQIAERCDTPTRAALSPDAQPQTILGTCPHEPEPQIKIFDWQSGAPRQYVHR